MRKALVVTILMLVLGAWTTAFAGGRNDGLKWLHFLKFGGGDSTDAALFDGTNPANQGDAGTANAAPLGVAGAVCGTKFAGQPFIFHLSVTNHSSGTAGFVRITYKDGDWVQFPIEPNANLQISQAAGSRSGNDQAVRVSGVPAGTGGTRLVGALSAQGLDGKVRCASCDSTDEGGIGDAGCDAFIPD
jgi:hypothetical protein